MRKKSTRKSTGVRCLLDVNILVALAIPEHADHPRVYRWFRREPDRKWATCAHTQAGFLRVGCLMLGNSRENLHLLYEGLIHDCQSPHHEFWSSGIDLTELDPALKSRLLGPNQIADLQLLLLAHKHRGQLVTLDKGLHELARGTKYANSLLVL